MEVSFGIFEEKLSHQFPNKKLIEELEVIWFEPKLIIQYRKICLNLDLRINALLQSAPHLQNVKTAKPVVKAVMVRQGQLKRHKVLELNNARLKLKAFFQHHKATLHTKRWHLHHTLRRLLRVLPINFHLSHGTETHVRSSSPDPQW